MDTAREEQSGKSTGPLTDEQKQARQQRQGLLLARARVLQQLESSSNDTYTRSLQQALRDLDEKIGKTGH